MMKKTIFTGAGVAIVTPMNPGESINYDELGRIIDYQIENGTDAIVVCGTTGESATMTDQEHVDCIAYTVQRVQGRVPVIAGAGSNHTSYAVWMSKEAKRAGADALLHVTPYYNKTSQTGLIRHFHAIADATDLPIILYNVPSRTGVNITPGNLPRPFCPSKHRGNQGSQRQHLPHRTGHPDLRRPAGCLLGQR